VLLLHHHLLRSAADVILLLRRLLRLLRQRRTLVVRRLLLLDLASLATPAARLLLQRLRHLLPQVFLRHRGRSCRVAHEQRHDGRGCLADSEMGCEGRARCLHRRAPDCRGRQGGHPHLLLLLLLLLLAPLLLQQLALLVLGEPRLLQLRLLLHTHHLLGLEKLRRRLRRGRSLALPPPHALTLGDRLGTGARVSLTLGGRHGHLQRR
jgi:hypothetical protein